VNDLPHLTADLEAIYQRRFAGKEDYRVRVWQVLTSQFFSRWISKSDTVLELGCGYCEFINQIGAAAKYGMDLNPASGRNTAKDVVFLQQDCSKLWPVAPGTLDTVFTSNFFEHLPTKTHLEETLRHAWLSLKPGGRLIAMGPNIKYVPGAYWDFFDHYLALTELSLAEVLKKCGFEIESNTARFLPYTMSNGSEHPIWMLKLYLAWPAAWRFFGKQFLIVARKKQELV
jgi:SAM-dependent methyltransferase